MYASRDELRVEIQILVDREARRDGSVVRRGGVAQKGRMEEGGRVWGGNRVYIVSRESEHSRQVASSVPDNADVLP